MMLWKNLLWSVIFFGTLIAGFKSSCFSVAYGEENHPQDTKVDVKVLEGYISSDSMYLVASNNKQSLPAFYYNDTGKIYAITKITKVPAGTHLKHLWFLRDQIILDSSLPVKENQMRVVSGLILKPNWTGKWHVDITAEDGTLLYSIPFIIKKKQEAIQTGSETLAPHQEEKKIDLSPISISNAPQKTN